MSTGLRHVALAALIIVAAGRAAAQGTEQDRAQSPLTFHHEQRVLQDQNLDTGWRPPNGLIQVRFQFQLGGGLEATLPGDGELAWPERYDLEYVGEELGGRFGMNVGVELSARLRFDLPLPGGGSIDWEGDIPFVPNFDFRFGDEAQFTPFLLEGSPDRPAHVEDEVDRAELFTVDLTDLILAIPGIGGGVILEAGGELQADLQGNKIDTLTRAGDSLRHDAEGEVVPWPPQQNWIEEGTATYEATVQSQGTIIFVPAVYIEFLANTWELAEFEIPVELPPRDEIWSFEPQPLDFELAHVNVSATSHDFGEVAVGGSASWTLTVINAGGSLLRGRVAVDGDFAVAPQSFELQSDATQDLLVRFLPGSAGPHESDVEIASNDPLWSPFNVSVRGLGLGNQPEPEVEIEPDAGAEADADADAPREAEVTPEPEVALEPEAAPELESITEPEPAVVRESEREEGAKGQAGDPGRGSGAGCDCSAATPGSGASPALLLAVVLVLRRRRIVR